MTDPALESRTTAVEQATVEMGRSVTRLSREMAEFKDEMAEFKNEMAEFKNETRASDQRFKEEIRASDQRFKEEIRASDQRFKEEMAEFKNETRASHQRWREEWAALVARWDAQKEEREQERRRETREWNKKWGESSNRLGTLVEDLVAPSLPSLAKPYLGVPPSDELELFGVRVRRRHPSDPSRTRELDCLCVAPQAWMVNDTRSRLTPDAIDAFLARLPELRELFPEYAARALYGCMASLYLDTSVVTYAERRGLLVLGVGDELMEVHNTPGFRPTAL
jgi:hypothetical protein